MQPASVVSQLPFWENSRSGQKEVFEAVFNDRSLKSLNIQLPTGYGKTRTATGVYSILKSQGRANRLLMVFPTKAQLHQFEMDGHLDLRKMGVDGDLRVTAIGYFGKEAFQLHREGRQVFATTVQGLSMGTAADWARDLFAMPSGGSETPDKWMLVVDEYHHYGVNKTWTSSVDDLNPAFRLAMSATPYRKNGDSAFGSPQVTVSYRAAVKEKAVKPLQGHSYNYRIEAEIPGEGLHSFTTDELARLADGDDPVVIERYRLQRAMRWSPLYVSPLVSTPLERLIRDREATGLPLQAIIGAMCVSHAKIVCDQVRDLFSPELTVDWVGTANAAGDGRPDDENEEVLSRFCPPKDSRGRRNPTLDVLVHVGMAGEGLDSIHVSEVIHLNRASKNNSNDQENGRAARFLPGVIGNINFDSCSDYATMGYIGSKIMDAMDCVPPSDCDDEERDAASGTPREIDWDFEDKPYVSILDMELEHIDSGDPEIQLLADAYTRVNQERILRLPFEQQSEELEDLRAQREDLNSELYQRIVALYKDMKKKEAAPHQERAEIEFKRKSLDSALSKVTSLVVALWAKAGGGEVKQDWRGQIKRMINERKKRALGAVAKNIELLDSHIAWVNALGRSVKSGEVPSWLRP